METDQKQETGKRPMNGWEAINSIIGNALTGAVICFIVWVIYLVSQ